MMGAARLSLMRMEGLEFWKLCGGGVGEGFAPRANMQIVAILCTWQDAATARRQIDRAPLFAGYKRRSAESLTVYLEPFSSRGEWSGREPFGDLAASPQQGPIAALTRATLRIRAMAAFWKQVPDVSDVIGSDPNVALKIGIGEVPLLHQVTFSIWPDAASMAAFARGNGPHARAIRAVRDGNWFREELYARFRVLDAVGTWNGTNPLAQIKAA